MSGKQVEFSKKQLQALKWWQTDGAKYDAIICDGAIRSGKTVSMGLSFFLWAMSSFHQQQFGLCGKTIVALRRNVIQVIVPMLRRIGLRCEEKRSENLLTVHSGTRKNSFYLFGGRDESSASLIQGSTFAGILLDEAALMPRSFVEQACARCSVLGSKLWFNCNPEGLNKLCGYKVEKENSICRSSYIRISLTAIFQKIRFSSLDNSL